MSRLARNPIVRQAKRCPAAAVRPHRPTRAAHARRARTNRARARNPATPVPRGPVRKGRNKSDRVLVRRLVCTAWPVRDIHSRHEPMTLPAWIARRLSAARASSSPAPAAVEPQTHWRARTVGWARTSLRPGQAPARPASGASSPRRRAWLLVRHA